MGIFDLLKSQLNTSINETIPDDLKPYAAKMSNIVSEISDKKIIHDIKMAQTQYTLPKDIEHDILNGISYTKCVQKLKSKKGFNKFSTEELKNMVSNVGTRLFAERTAQLAEKDFEYYRVSPCSENSCPICKKATMHPVKFRDRKVGINFPPLHDGCTCSITIEEPTDWNAWIDNYEKKHK